MNKKLEEAISNNWIKSTPIDLGGRNFYEFHEDGAKMSQSRFEAFSDVLTKHEVFQTTQDDVESFLSGIKEAIKIATLDIKTSPQHAYDNLERAKALIGNFEQRQKLGNPLERSLELASFLYITEEENPFDYNDEINKEKIEFFKKKADTVLPIILERVLPSFLTWQNFFQLSFLNSMRGNLDESMHLLMSQLTSSSLYANGKESDGSLASRVETLASVITSYTDLLKNVTNMRLTGLPNSDGKGQTITPEEPTDGREGTTPQN